MGEQANRDLSMEDVVRKVVEITGVNESNIVGKSRKKEFVEARQTAMFLCRSLLVGFYKGTLLFALLQQIPFYGFYQQYCFH